MRELASAAHKICMDVRLCHRCDAEPILSGQFSIAVYVAFGIIDQSLSGTLAAREISVLRRMGSTIVPN